MLKKIISIIVILIIPLIFCACVENNITVSEGYELIRIHIRANSNSEEDQKVKIKVKEAVTEYLNSALGDVENRDDAYNGLSERKSQIKNICDKTLKNEGFGYVARVSLTNEYFPVRQYETVIVESGYYDALIIELGDGDGDNWWCVIYPPLCYLEAEYGDGFRYKSKLKELIDKYFG